MEMVNGRLKIRFSVGLNKGIEFDAEKGIVQITSLPESEIVYSGDQNTVQSPIEQVEEPEPRLSPKFVAQRSLSRAINRRRQNRVIGSRSTGFKR